MPACPSTGSSGHFSPLSRTPEISSGSETEYTPTTTTTTSPLSRSQSLQINGSRNIRGGKSSRNSTAATNFSEQEWQDVLSGRHYKKRGSRRVSFDAEAEAKARSDEEEDEVRKLRLAHQHEIYHHQQQQQSQQQQPYQQPQPQHRNPLDELAASGSQHWFNTTTSATIHRRRTRTLSRDGYGMSHPSSSRRGVSGSAPVSPRASMHLSDAQRAKLLNGLGIEGSGISTDSYQHAPPPARHSPPLVSSRPRYVPAPASQHEVAVLRSLQSAQHHITKTTSTALSFSRSLLAVPAPVVRPLMQATLLWWVSSATLFALGTCLLASYCLTMWDDVHGRKRAAAAARGAKGEERGCDPSTPPATAASSRRSSTAAASMALDAGKMALDSLVLSPIHLATKLPLAVAYSLAPRAVPSASAAAAAAAGEEGADNTAAASHDTQEAREREQRSKDARERPLPPRPPLSSLIPSMFFTLLLALGAGLIGGWAKKRSSSSEGKQKATAAATTAQDEDEKEVEGLASPYMVESKPASPWVA